MRLQFWCLFVCVGIREAAPADSLEKRVPSVVGEKVGIGFAFDHGLQERKRVLVFLYRMNFMPDPKDFTALHIAAQKASLLISSRVDDRAVQNRLVDLAVGISRAVINIRAVLQQIPRNVLFRFIHVCQFTCRIHPADSATCSGDI